VKYYWETIEACVRPELIIEALNKTGFTQVKRDSRFGVLSEYTAVK
jgi:demethylmenaquinone methyltransferase/2-methoxy-6-polyprenyl-1,4-benzoquinol methylase